jgi:hypothetical protein
MRSYAPRHELKFLVSETDALWLSARLRAVLSPDENAGPDGSYLVRSLYLDDAYDSAFYEKVAGVPSRDKYRLRLYNQSDALILLERKRKLGDLILKESVRITRRMAERVASGDPTGLDQVESPLVRDLFREMRTRLLRPVVVVDYEREALCHPAETARVTFDRRLRTGPRTALFEPDTPTLPAMDQGQLVLEVKYDRVLPGVIQTLLRDAPATRCAFSKYVTCRRFEPLG